MSGRAVSIVVRLARDSRAQDTLEYALAAAFVAVVSVGALNLIKTSLGTAYTAWGTQVNALSCMPSPGGGGCP